MPILRMISGLSRSPNTMSSLISRAAPDASAGSTSDQLATQWSNPSDVLSLLLLIGGDIIQKALASTAGGPLVPVCFSFGWLSYAFKSLFALLGDGRLLPPPDHPAKVFNLATGYVRENQNFVVGRILRDHVIRVTREYPLGGGALRVSVYEALACKEFTARPAGRGRVMWVWFAVTVAQLAIAAIPAALYLEWGILMTTAAGTFLAWAAGSLPQWSIEKLSCRRNSYKNFALTSGNGSRDIMIVLGRGNGLDLEDLATPESPRSTRLWEKRTFESRSATKDGKLQRSSNKMPRGEVLMYRGIPYGFWKTTLLCIFQCLLWIALLVTIAGLKSHSWYLIAAGGLGMFQNVAAAAISRGPEKRNLPLRLVEVINAVKVMDGLMDLEVSYPGLAQPLVDEFFPGKLRADEIEWWRGDKAQYDKRRFDEKDWRGIPRAPLPNYVPISTPKLNPEKDPDTNTHGSAQEASVHVDARSQVAEAQEVAPNKTSSAPHPVPMTRSSQNMISIGEDAELAHSPGLGIRPPKTPSSSAATGTRPEIKERSLAYDYAQMPPATGVDKPVRRGTRETEKTDNSSSTGLSMYDIDAIVRTPDWN